MPSEWIAALGLVTTAAAGIGSPAVTAYMNRRQRRQEDAWLVVDDVTRAVGCAIDCCEDCFVLWSRKVPADAPQGQEALRAVHGAPEEVRFTFSRVAMRLGPDHAVSEHVGVVRIEITNVWNTHVSAFEDGKPFDQDGVEEARERLTSYATSSRRWFTSTSPTDGPSERIAPAPLGRPGVHGRAEIAARPHRR